MNTTATSNTKKVRVIKLEELGGYKVGSSVVNKDFSPNPLKVGEVLDVVWAEDSYICIKDRFTIDNEGDLCNFSYTTNRGHFEIIE